MILFGKTNVEAQEFTVTFPQSFNVGSSVKIILSLQGGLHLDSSGVSIRSVDETSFTARVNFPVSSLFTVHWVASDEAAIDLNAYSDLLSGKTKSFNNLPLLDTPPDNNDEILIFDISDKKIKRLCVEDLLNQTLIVVTPPASPSSPGEVNQIAIDDEFLYTHDGILWGRTPRATENW